MTETDLLITLIILSFLALIAAGYWIGQHWEQEKRDGDGLVSRVLTDTLTGSSREDDEEEDVHIIGGSKTEIPLPQRIGKWLYDRQKRRR